MIEDSVESPEREKYLNDIFVALEIVRNFGLSLDLSKFFLTLEERRKTMTKKIPSKKRKPTVTVVGRLFPVGPSLGASRSVRPK